MPKINNGLSAYYKMRAWTKEHDIYARLCSLVGFKILEFTQFVTMKFSSETYLFNGPVWLSRLVVVHCPHREESQQ